MENLLLLANALQLRFIEKKWTLSLAESCTGGAMAATLTQIPGASSYFLGSIVAYSNALKSDLLKVPPQLIQEKGAVSREVVQAMLEGVLELTGSDCAAAVSGISGPTGGTPTKPVGTVWGAIGTRRGFQRVWSWHIEGTRQDVIAGSVRFLLEELFKIP